MLSWTIEEFGSVRNTEHVDDGAKPSGLEGARPASTPSSEATSNSIGEALGELPHHFAKVFQQAAELLNYVAADMSGIQQSVKIILADMRGARARAT